MNIYDLLVWLSGAGAVIAVSWVCERSTKFQALAPSVKSYVQYGASVLVACGALAIQQFVPPQYIEAIAPYVGVGIAIFGMVFLNQAAHVLDPAKYRK